MRAWSTMLVAAAVLVATGSAARADLGERVVYAEPAQTLVMPFDVTGDRRTFAIVSRIGGSGPVATHWSYWAADCRHLADVVICLTPKDTVVVDPTSVRGEVQTSSPPANTKIGPTVDLTGNQGLLTVTAYAATTGPSGQECRIADPTATLDDVLVGSWTIANAATSSAFGGDAIGLSSTGGLPDPEIINSGGLYIPSFNPQDLTDSVVIVLPVEFPGGSGVFEGSEIGPLSRSVSCDTAFIDNLEIPTSLPDLTFRCATFKPIAAELAGEDENAIVPPTVAIVSSGLIHLTNCETSRGPLNQDQFLFAFHGQAVGPFGTSATAKYAQLID
jgi:hypothetical protein